MRPPPAGRQPGLAVTQRMSGHEVGQVRLAGEPLVAPRRTTSTLAIEAG